MFKNMKLAVRLIGGFGIVLVLLAVVMGIYQYALRSATTGFKGVMSEEIVISNYSWGIATSMLQCRRDEKDFLLRLDLKYAAKLETNIAEMNKWAKGIVDVAGKSGKKGLEARASAIIGYAQAYHNAFKTVVASWETKGLDEKSGLQGKFRNAVHQVGNDVDKLNNTALKTLLLDVRKNEKDYLLRGDDKYVKATRAGVDKLLEAVKASGVSSEMADQLETKLNTYKANFDALVAADKKISAITETMRAAIHKIEPEVESFHKKAMDDQVARIEKTTAQTEFFTRVAIGIGFGAILAGIFLAFFITRSITKPIKLIIAGLNEGGRPGGGRVGPGIVGQPAIGGRRIRTGSLHRGDVFIAGRDVRHDQTECRHANEADTLMKEANQVVGKANDP